ncbi:MAG TPA: hypothetical protein PKI59_01955, partial [Candidatus Cloacimonadota bacterium]|nr:hypothetical protein [Candidatus Cloacimonadota bacterium]
LYYRLNVIKLHIPPLLERKDDIKFLANAFVKEFCTKYKKAELRISPGVLSILLNYEWKGNIRELRNALEHAVILAENKVIQPEDLPENVSGNALNPDNLYDYESSTWADAKRIFSKAYLHNLLTHTGGNVLRAASIADITRENFYKKCSTLGIDWRVYRINKEKENGEL